MSIPVTIVGRIEGVPASLSDWLAEVPSDVVLPPAQLGLCVVYGCDRRVGRKGARGLCPRHYLRLWATGSPTGSNEPTQEARFFRFVQQSGNDCWIWSGSSDQSGYGMFSANGRSGRSHIWAYKFLIGDIPPGLQLDHRCHTDDPLCPGGDACPHRACCNPWHLEPVTPLENFRRGERCRPRAACPQGHKYDEANTYLNPLGRKVCRTCTNTYRDRYNSKKKAGK